jgi:hypothetical protein
MGGKDGEGAAPLGNGFGDVIEEALIFVEGELVNFNVTAFAGESVWIGREAINAAAVGELEDGSIRVVGGIEDQEAEVGCAEVEELGPFFAVFEVETSLEFVSRSDPDIVARIGTAGEEDGMEGVGFCRADLAGFFHDFERVIV